MFIRLLGHRVWLGFVFLLFATPAAWATSWSVNSSADPATGSANNCTAGNPNTCTLRDAIAAAGNSDIITFGSSATLITLTSNHPLVLNQAPLTIDGGGGAVVDGNLATRVFEVASVADITLVGLTIRNGQTIFDGAGIYNQGTLTLTQSTLSGNSAGGSGGGIYNSAGTLTLINSTLSGNVATSNSGGGGGIYNNAIGTLTLTDSTLSGNVTTSNSGGGIYNAGMLTVTLSTLSGNSAKAGGGIYNQGTFTLTQSALSGNSAPIGGGISNAAGTLTLTSSMLSGNSATFGGGFYNQGTLILTLSTVSGNSAGGIFNTGTLTLINSTVSGNSAFGYVGGGIFNDGTLTLIQSTLSDNSASLGGDIYNNGGSITLNNTILNEGSGNGGVCFGGLPIDQGGNLDSGISCGVSSAQSNATINLGPLQNNGGPTQTMLPGAGSAAIDAIACTNAPPADQRGVTRPQGATCDSGAVEVKQTGLTVEVSGNGNNQVTATAGAIPVSPIVGINLCGSGSGSCTAYYNIEGSPVPSVSLTLMPITGWHVVSVTSDTCTGSLSGDPYKTATYTTAALTASCTVSVIFAVNQTSSPTPVPALSVWLLLLLCVVLMGAGLRTALRWK